ncbi:hypothetical protein NO2_1439, partial [Candidatus Termititenax persephonae]
MRRWGGHIICVLLLVSLAQAANPFDLRRYLKKILENQLSTAVSKNVSIGELRGNVYNRLIISDVEISEADGQNTVLIGRAEVNYSLKNIILQRFDILSNIHSITVSDAYLLVKRDAAGRWNYALPSTDQTSKPVNPKKSSPRMQIHIANAGARYIDERGWGKQRLAKRYDQRFHNLNGTVSIDGEDILFTASGVVTPGATLTLNGRYNKGYSVNIAARRVNLAEHGYYALSFSDYTLPSGWADINIRVAAAENSAPALEASAQISGVEFQPGDYLTEPLRNISGGLRWSANRLYLDNLHAALLDTALTLNGSLLLGKTPELNVQAGLQDFDFQKKYSQYFYFPELTGRGALSLALTGPLAQPSGRGSLRLADCRYGLVDLGPVEAEIDLRSGQGELFFRLPERLTGSLVFQGDWQNLNSAISLNAAGLQVAALAQKDASQNITAQITSAQLDFATNNLLQTYFPGSAGQIELNGAVLWQGG